jgi:hypothetical protein
MGTTRDTPQGRFSHARTLSHHTVTSSSAPEKFANSVNHSVFDIYSHRRLLTPFHLFLRPECLHCRLCLYRAFSGISSTLYTSPYKENSIRSSRFCYNRRWIGWTDLVEEGQERRGNGIFLCLILNLLRIHALCLSRRVWRVSLAYIILQSFSESYGVVSWWLSVRAWLNRPCGVSLVVPQPAPQY